MEYPVNAGKIPVTALPGSSYFDSADSFGLIRGRHVDLAIMGGLQVDAQAILANWVAPGRPLLGVGGAMDLAQGAKRPLLIGFGLYQGWMVPRGLVAPVARSQPASPRRARSSSTIESSSLT